MARRRLHSDESILDATRDLLVVGGADAATTAAISSASGAPVGSLYHRFGSRTRLFAEVWLRTVGRFQTGLLEAAADGSGVERAVAAARWTVEFADRRPDDARLLLQAGQEQLLRDADLPAETRQALTDLNRPVTDLLRGLAVDLYGAATPRHVELVTVAVVDVPYAMVRRHLRRGGVPASLRAVLADVVRAVLTSPT
ncbi:TetR/AcrR family transcriptional regulator [Actinophytocola sp. NPDC049390]|uniref:TetR/AcrR family transcriptional regulator n=1 Tax=Actinophytocola sp. NPDC049390 TaxID=3363894 RepID=UPI0037B9E3A4